MHEPIRILHMIGSLNIGGSQSMIINLHKAIDRSKVQFDYIIDHPGHLHFAPIVEALGGKIYSLPTFRGYNFLGVRKAWKKFFKDHPEYRILHSHVRSYASLYLPIAKKAGLKTIIHSHNTSSGKGIKAIVKWFMQRGLRSNIDYYFACSDVAGKWLFGDKIVNQPNYFLLKNAIDVEKYAYSESSRKKIREEFNLTDKFVVGHVGRFHPQKNHFFLIDVFAEIHKNNSNSVLMLVGTGELMNPVKERVVELGLTDCVIFTGVRADVNELLSAFDIFVFPSLFEGLPVTLVEAQASGLECLVSDTITKEIGLSELIRYIPLNQGVLPWVRAVNNFCNERKNVSHKIQDAGYDAKSSAAYLASFYKKVINSIA